MGATHPTPLATNATRKREAARDRASMAPFGNALMEWWREEAERRGETADPS